MKTLNQIYRYTSDCRFPDGDWQKVLAYCRELFKGGKIHKALSPKDKSTYDQFIDWIENGFGPGDFVSYGKTMGIVGSSTPSGTTLAAYCDYEGKFIQNDMLVLEPNRLQPLEEERIVSFQKLMFEKGVNFFTRQGKIDKIYTPEKYFYIIFQDDHTNAPDVGMFLESDDCKYHFLAFLSGDKLRMDCWIDSNYTPIRQASEVDIKRLHAAAAAAGYFYNERAHKFAKIPKRGQNNAYWYLNERFEILMDKDNGSRKHLDRFKAGNYFVDYTEAIYFMKDIRKMRGTD